MILETLLGTLLLLCPPLVWQDLLNAVGASTYHLIQTLALPGVPKHFTFEQIVEKITAHYNPKPVIITRFEFNTRVQKGICGRIHYGVSQYYGAL